MSVQNLENLSPFEIKDVMIDIASSQTARPLLNAGRGNPNFIAVEPREAYFLFGHFALAESKIAWNDAQEIEALGAFPIKRESIKDRLDQFLASHPGKAADLLKGVCNYAVQELKWDINEFLAKMTEGILGCEYPVPPKVLPFAENIIKDYVIYAMGADHLKRDDIDIFPLEGGTAAMAYVFETLRNNGIINLKDKIALGMPIFQPYIEYNHLREYQLVQVDVSSSFETKWQYTKDELDKLLDPSVKAFFVVNPTNPTSVKLEDRALEYIGEILKKRPDLIILTDDVYGTFNNGFKSLFGLYPHNTILVYSYSKYYGATGHRLGVVATHKKNIFDEKINTLSGSLQAEIKHRYSSLYFPKDPMRFVDKIVAESRHIALNHTSGLSTPQQVQMILFSLFEIMDKQNNYKNMIQGLVKSRLQGFYEGIGLPFPEDSNSTYYYHIIDLLTIFKSLKDQGFADWFEKNYTMISMLEVLAQYGLIFLAGKGFGISEFSIRVSLANLSTKSYKVIGSTLKEIANDLYDKYQKA